MPTYVYECPGPDGSFELIRRLSEHQRLERCPRCGALSQQVLTRPMVAIDYPEYISPATGRLIRGKRQHLEDLKASGCRILEPGESERFIREAPARRDKAFEKLASDIVDSVVPYIPS